MKKPNTAIRVARLFAAIILMAIIEYVSATYYPATFTVVYLSGLIWAMLIIAYFIHIMGDWYKYHEHRILNEVQGEEDTI